MFREKITEHGERVETLLKEFPHIAKIEASTKGSLIEPFLRRLGYDTSHPQQVSLEVLTELGGRIDYLLTGRTNAKIAVEAKKADTTLSVKETNQLRSYFTFSEAVAGVLTNGVDVWLFTDLDKANVMDAEPYLMVDIRTATENDILHLQTLTRSQVSQSAIHEQARRERYRRLVNKIVIQELHTPSQEFLRLIGRKAGLKPLTKPNLNMLAPLVYEALGRKQESLPTPQPSPPLPPSSPSPKALASLFGDPLPAKTYRQVLIAVVSEMQNRHPDRFAETVSNKPFVKVSRTWQWISSNRQDLSPARQFRQVGDYFLDVNLNAKNSVGRARSFLNSFGYSPTDLEVHSPPKGSTIKGATLFGQPIPAKTYIEMFTSVVSELQARHPNDFADRVRDPKVFRGSKRWIISKDPNDLGTAKTKRKVGEYWVYAGGTGRIPRAHKFLRAFG